MHAKVVVVACGGLHSPLLLKSSGLAPFGSQVGRNLTLHPGFRVSARFDETVRGWAGAMQSAYTDHYERENVTLMGVFVPGTVLVATMPGVGPELQRRARTVPETAMFGAMVHDEGGGVVRRAPGREPFVTYRMTPRDKRAMFRAIRLLAETFLEAGAKEIYLPVLGMEPIDADAYRRLDVESLPTSKIECSSQHPLGTCRMAPNASLGVVDHLGRLFDLENVFVCDGSILPTSLGVNPQLTIMAMATRLGERLRDRYRRLAH